MKILPIPLNMSPVNICFNPVNIEAKPPPINLITGLRSLSKNDITFASPPRMYPNPLKATPKVPPIKLPNNLPALYIKSKNVFTNPPAPPSSPKASAITSPISEIAVNISEKDSKKKSRPGFAIAMPSMNPSNMPTKN